MSTTRWERQKAVSGQLRAIWDAKRDGVNTWPQAFEQAREALAQRMEADRQMVLAMSWDEFRRLEGWHEKDSDEPSTGALPTHGGQHD